MSAKGGIKKLTMVNAYVNGRLVTKFVQGLVTTKINSVTGKPREVTVVDRSVFESSLLR